MRTGKRGLGLLILFNLAALFSLERGYSETTENEILAWLREDPKAAPYRSEESGLRDLLNDSGRRKVPLSLLFDKLKEGASKRVAPPALVKVLAEEKNRLVKTEEFLRTSAFTIQGEEAKELYKTCSIALLNGLDEEILRSVLTAAKENGKSPEAVIELLPVLFRMNGIARLPEAGAASFVSAVYGGKLPRGQYGSLVSLFLKAAAGRLSPETILRIMEDSLNSGGGILQIERELTRRTRR